MWTVNKGAFQQDVRRNFLKCKTAFASCQQNNWHVAYQAKALLTRVTPLSPCSGYPKLPETDDAGRLVYRYPAVTCSDYCKGRRNTVYLEFWHSCYFTA